MATLLPPSDGDIGRFGLSSICYENHPAFAGVPFCDDEHIERLAAELSAALEMVRARAKLPSTDVEHQLRRRIVPAAERLFSALQEKNRTIEAFVDFADKLKRQLMALIAEDISISSDRGLHAYIDGSPRADAIAQSLWAHGTWLGRLDAAAVVALETAMAEPKKRLWERHQRDGRIDRESLSINEWPEAEISRALAAVFNEPDITTALSNYMGACYAYSGCAFELSVPGTVWWSNRYGSNYESTEAAYFHVDQSWRFPKMICYLSDVTEANGPTSFLTTDLEQSALSWVSGRALDGVHVDPNRGDDTSMAKMLVCGDVGRRCFAALPREMRCLGHFGNDLLAGSPQERYLLSHRQVMTGPPGTCVVFDGSRTAHRGGIVRAGRRWAFQVIYGKQT